MPTFNVGVRNEAIRVQVGGTITSPTLPANYKGPLVAHSNALGTSSVTAGTEHDIGWTADMAGFMGDGSSVFTPTTLPANATGYLVYVVEDGVEAAEPATWIPLVGTDLDSAVDFSGTVNLRKFYPVLVDTGVGLNLRVEPPINFDDEAATGYRRGYTIQAQGIGAEPSNEANTILRVYLSVNTPSIVPQGPKGDQGERGEQGIQGIQGEQGIQGIQGEQGERGQTGSPGSGSTVASDATLTGTGEPSDPLKVAEPYTAAERTKLATVQDNAAPNRTFGAIAAGLNQLPDLEKLNASAVKDLPGITVEDEGTTPSGTATTVKTINFAGANVTATVSNGVATITVSGGSASAPTKKQVFDLLVTILHTAGASLGLQLNQNNTLNTLTIAPITAGARVVSNAQIQALFATFTRVGALTGATVEHMQRLVDMLQGGAWTDVENLPGAAVTTVPAIGETLNHAAWDATSILSETFGLRFSGGVHVAQARFTARIPVAWLEDNTLTRLSWSVGSLANDVDSFQDIVRYPLSESLFLVENGGYRYYAKNEPEDRAAGSHYRISFDEPTTLDPDITVPQATPHVALTRAAYTALTTKDAGTVYLVSG